MIISVSGELENYERGGYMLDYQYYTILAFISVAGIINALITLALYLDILDMKKHYDCDSECDDCTDCCRDEAHK